MPRKRVIGHPEGVRVSAFIPVTMLREAEHCMAKKGMRTFSELVRAALYAYLAAQTRETGR